MRKWLLLLLAITAASFPAGAQTPAPQRGLKTGNIEVLPGQMDKFKQITTKVITAVRKSRAL